jgi:hypothetical protein
MYIVINSNVQSWNANANPRFPCSEYDVHIVDCPYL